MDHNRQNIYNNIKHKIKHIKQMFENNINLINNYDLNDLETCNIIKIKIDNT